MAMGRDLSDATTPGTILARRYRVVRELGRGGMAKVLEVDDLVENRRVALKLLKADIEQHGEAMERFRREGEFLLSLRHPAIVAVEASGQLPDGRLYLAMELLHGETLGARMRRGRMNPDDLSPILAGAAVGLAAAHRAGVVHRDLKPDNVFLAKNPTDRAFQVKLLDFGISKIDGRATLTRTGQVLGTPRYMAPEQLAAERDLDGRTDVYALGVILYEALAGQPPFPATLPSELIVSILNGKVTPLRAFRPDLPPAIDAVVMRAMARVREARYESPTALAEAWFDVVHVAVPRSPAKPDMRTNVLGGVASPKDVAVPGALVPGTFRDYEQNQTRLGLPEERLRVDGAREPAPPAKAQPAHATVHGVFDAASPAARPDAARSATAFQVARGQGAPGVEPANAHGATRAGAAPVADVKPGASLERAPLPHRESSEPTEPTPYELPTRKVPWLAIGIAAMLIAGGLSGLALERRVHDARSTRDAPDASMPDAATLDGSAGAVAPTNVVVEPPLIRDARSALATGNPRRCIELATEALAGSEDAAAYRLRGDCYRAVSDETRALRSYQRFCAAAPDSPDLAEVRRIATSLGGTCP